MSLERMSKVLGAAILLGLSVGCVSTNGGAMNCHVVDRLENASRYCSGNKLFERAFEFVRTHDLATLPVGRYEIAGDDCYAMVQEPMLKPLSEGRYELHREYFDIQVPISCEEVFGLVETPSDVLAAATWEGGDIHFFNAPITPVTIKPGEFAILAPLKGAHAPCLTDGTPHKVKKLVIKVRANPQDENRTLNQILVLL